MFRPTSGKTRKRGVRKPNIGFRCPLDLYEYLMALKARGTEPTEVITRALRIVKDMGERLGDEWWEVERRANVTGVNSGSIVADLVLQSLAHERNSKAKK